MKGFLRSWALIALAGVLLFAGRTAGESAWSTGVGVWDSAAKPSFAPHIQFWGDVHEDGFQISVGFAKRDLRYDAGESICLVLAIRNATAQPQRTDITTAYQDYRVAVADGTGAAVPLTDLGQGEERGRDAISNRMPVLLPPQGACTETLPIGELFSMSAPGAYTITVTREVGVWTPDSGGGHNRGVMHQVGPITIIVGALPPESPVVLGPTLGPSALPVAWDANAKQLTISGPAARTEAQGSGSQTNGTQGTGLAPGTGASVAVLFPDLPAGEAPHLSQRVVDVITTFLDHVNDQPPATQPSVP